MTLMPEFTIGAETMRLRAIRETGLSGTNPSPRFDRLTQMMKMHLKAEIAYITFIEDRRQWFLSKHGLSVSESPRDTSFCNHVVATDKALLVSDARQDKRFAESPLVDKPGGIRSYLGLPLRLASGITIGAVCVADSRPDQFSSKDIDYIQLTSSAVSDAIAARMSEMAALQKSNSLHRSNTALTSTKQMLSSAEAIAKIGSWSVSSGLQTLTWSDETYRLHGLTPGTRLDLSKAVRFYVEEDRDMVARKLAEAIRDRSSFAFEATILTAQREKKPVKVMGDYILGAGMQPDAIVGVIRAV